MALLNQQTAELRRQLDGLQGLLDAAEASDAAAQVQIETLGANLNAALARVAAEERARAELEARERARLEAEAQDLTRYRSEFFGRMREILGEREGVQVVGDRFVFPSEVLFAAGLGHARRRGPGAGRAGRRGHPRHRRRHPARDRLGAARRRPHRHHPGQPRPRASATTGS